MREGLVPFFIGGFPARQCDGLHLWQLSQQMRSGEFDDAPDAAGAEVIMDDDEFHTRQVAKTILRFLKLELVTRRVMKR